MSLQTTLARATARATEERWHDHFHLCPPCQRWVQRRLGSGCVMGRELREDNRQAQAILRRERELDNRPSPGQGQLWCQAGDADA